jgi:hypothetical protein
MVGEGCAEILPVVVVAGNDQEWNRKSGENLPERGVFRRLAMVDQISGEQHQIRLRVDREYVRDGLGHSGVRVHNTLVENTFGSDVQTTAL